MGCGAFVFSKKLSYLRGKLRVWAKVSFGSINLQKLDLMHEVDDLDIIKETWLLNPSKARQELALLERLGNICKQEEVYWKQRARLQWLKKGEENIKFFHAVANGRKNHNFLPMIVHDGNTSSKPKEIGKVFLEKFKQLFGRKRDFRYRIDLRKLFHNRVSVDLSHLKDPSRYKRLKVLFSIWVVTKLQGCMDFHCISLSNLGRLSRGIWLNFARIFIQEGQFGKDKLG